MLPDPPEMQNARLEEIDRGQTDAFEFRITGETLRVFADLLAAGAGKPAGSDVAWQDQFHLPNLLSILLFSHFRGDLPAGGLRDVSEFSAEGDGEAELRHRAQLQAEGAPLVVYSDREEEPHDFQVDQEGQALFRGKASALVNAPSRRMPTMQELKPRLGLRIEGQGGPDYRC